MGKLTINFQFMFLLTGVKKGGIVLLPAAGHKASLEVSGSNDWIPLDGVQVDIRDVRTGVRVWGNPSTPPKSEPVVRMRDVFESAVYVQPTYITDPVNPEQIHARFVLGRGAFIHDLASDARFRHVKWHFVKSRGTHKQTLTDLMSFELEFATDHEIVFTSWKGTAPTRIHLPADATTVINVVNKDVAKTKLLGLDLLADEQDYVLNEFQTLYNLLGPGDRPLGPVGRGPKLPPFLGNGEPICGGAESDPEESDDPPDP